eukprot:5541178-Karenia_brevis.AAC.1
MQHEMDEIAASRMGALAQCIAKARQFLAVAPPKMAAETMEKLVMLEDELRQVRNLSEAQQAPTEVRPSPA